MMRRGFGVWVAPLMLLVAVTTVWLASGERRPAFAATLVPKRSAHQLRSLSMHDLNTLPDSTLIALPGRTVTLGAMRRSHLAFAHFRSNASAIGLRAHKSISIAPRMLSQPIPRPPQPLQLPVTGKPLPSSYLSYCKAVQATLCLIYPPDSLFFANEQPGSPSYNANAAAEAAEDGADSRGVVTVDPWVSSAICIETGGYMTPFDGCGWKFPIFVQARLPVSIGHYALAKDPGCATIWSQFPPLFLTMAAPVGTSTEFSLNGALISMYNNYNGAPQLDCWLQVTQT
jgi:hypothetical protein